MIDRKPEDKPKKDRKTAALFTLSLAIGASGAGISIGLKDLVEAVKVGNEVAKVVKCESSFTVKPVPIK